MRTLATIVRSAIPVLVTLTFPDEAIPASAEEAKRRLDRMGKRVRRRWPGAGVLWRMGVVLRKTGAFVGLAVPHFHLLTWGVRFRDLFDDLPSMWASINLPTDHSDYAKHLSAGTRVEKPRSMRGVSWYMAKGYIAKGDPEPGPEWMGRRWGVWNRAAIPWATAVIREVAWRDFHAVRRLLARAAHRQLRGAFPWQGLSIFSGAPGAYIRLGVPP